MCINREFTSKYHVVSMSGLARVIGASLYQRSTDSYIHEELRKLQKLDNILSRAEAGLALVIKSIASDAINFGKAFIFSDHSYDTFCTPQGECYLEHGPLSKNSSTNTNQLCKTLGLPTRTPSNTNPHNIALVLTCWINLIPKSSLAI